MSRLLNRNEYLNHINKNFLFSKLNSPNFINDPLFDYNFMMSLDEKDYPRYLSIAYHMKTDKKLDLRHPKTLNEKIQWLKIYDNTPIKTTLTDKVLVRDYVKEKIGEEYLKPVLWIGNNFDEIPFDKLPDSFIIKANNGCKWHYIIKNKKEYLSNKELVSFTRVRLNEWMKQSFFGWSDFETQYINIKPQLLIEPLMRDNPNEVSKDLCVWCINSKPYIDIEGRKCAEEAIRLSKILAEGFRFVRVDWMLYNEKLYFGEMTFTPSSGFMPDEMLNQNLYKELNKNLKLR